MDEREETGRSRRDYLISTTPEEEKMGMQQAHISALESKHAGLDARIAEETQRKLPDAALLSRLKKEKLRVKEELQGI
jgi:hypothetical protein